jgi:hypothetical protein
VRRAPIAPAAVVLLLVAGCGSSSGPATPSDAVKQFIAAVKSADGKKACSLLAPQAKARVVRGNLSCETAIKQLGPLLALQLTKVKVGAATVHGSSATVPLSTAQRRGVYALQKTGGRWVIVALSAR